MHTLIFWYSEGFRTIRWPVFLIVLLFVLLLSSCKDEPANIYELGSLKSSNPYTGKETLIFVNTAQDTLIFNGYSRTSKFIEGGNGGGNGEYNLYERDDTYFYSSDFRHRLRVQLSAECCNSDDIVIFYSWEPDTVSGSYVYSPVFNFPLPISNHSSHVTYLSYLSVLGNTYNHVYCSTCYNYNYPVPYPNKLYYTVNEGIIKMDYTDGSKLELLRIEH